MERNIPPDVVLSWNPPDDPVTSYSVKVYNQAEVLVFEASVPAANHSLLFPGL